ncbi:Shedu anti-phage system protein SduA domain-containing protein [Sphingobacterium lumbrici]|uniref:Shedu anti-phage system protein SduA domain-containing protein n=1 Tax=Sphingobacterium lumbrici TaxID=2559600 RepID=UPI001127F062|nr:Shedu anti-phage system protein SduA domain-containing protein [Sphingobacterium lumbrici]
MSSNLEKPYSFEERDLPGEVSKEISKSDDSESIFFTPPKEAVLSDRRGDWKRAIITIDRGNKLLKLYPYQVWGVEPMKNRYLKLKTINFELKENELSDYDSIDLYDFLDEVLPNSFLKNYNFGLGFKKNYRSIVKSLEDFEINELTIVYSEKTAFDISKHTAIINRVDLNEICNGIDSLTKRVQRLSYNLKRESVGSWIVQSMNGEHESTYQNMSKEITKQIGSARKFLFDGANKREQKDAMDVIRRNGTKILREQPLELNKLRNEIELVSLEQLIDNYVNMLNVSTTEAQWQKLFEQNPFILNMIFGVPIMMVQGQATVGGRNFSGKGDKITDFLVKNAIGGNAALIEIKTPSMELLKRNTYRGGVFGPSDKLTSSVNQVLDQIYHFPFKTSLN